MLRLLALGGICWIACLVGCGKSVTELNQMGLAEFEAGNYSYANAYFQQAWQKDRERPETLYNLGRCALAMAEQRFQQRSFIAALRYVDDAVSWFDSAIASFPGYTAAQNGKVRGLELQDKYSQAFDAAQWADDVAGPAAREKIVLAAHYERIGDMDQAQLCYRQAVAMEPDNSYAHAEMGRFYARRGQKDNAILHLRRAAALNPEEPGVLRDLKELSAAPTE
jgi:tetratricopeptide (TPR) repeat protein